MEGYTMVKSTDLTALTARLEAIEETQKEILDKVSGEEEFPPKMSLKATAKALGVHYRTVQEYTKRGAQLDGLNKYYDQAGQPYCKGEEVRKFKYGLR